MSILVVGASGQIGAAVLGLAAERDIDVVGLVRRPAPHVDRYAKVYQGDARRANLGLSEDEADELASTVNSIVVATGSFQLSLPLAAAQSEHIAPLRGVLRFAERCASLRNLVLVSSLLAVGDARQRLRSDHVPDPAAHHNFYEWAKLHGERVARASRLPVDIVRAGHVLVTGDEGTPPAPPAALFELLRLLCAGWPLPVVGSNRYWSAPPEFVAQVVLDRAALGTGGSSVWAVDPASPTTAEILDLINARYGVRVKRIRHAGLARTLAAVVRPQWLDLPMARDVLDYCNVQWDLDLRCLEELLSSGRVTAPADRGYLVRSVDYEFTRLREHLP